MTRPSFLLPVCALALVGGLLLPCDASAARAGGAHGMAVVAQNDPDATDDPASASALLIRIEKLETRLRTMTGQIEQLQYQNQRLDEQLRKMQQDVDFRFQDLGKSGGAPAGRAVPLKRGDAEAPPSAPDIAVADAPPAEPVAPAPAPAPAAKPARRGGDAFDPDATPNAPGAPRPLGTTPPSEPLKLRALPAGGEPHAPLDLTPHSGRAAAVPAGAPEPDGAIDVPPAGTVPAPRPPVVADAGQVASLAPGGTRTEYETDYSLYKDGQFDAAATGFTAFVEKYPRDRLVPDATYFLGESYAKLGRQREAAEQFLKVSTDYTKSVRAPDALLRLGIALNALGAKEQACATYQEVSRKYPAASPDTRAGVDRELKRSRCAP